jgi:gliding motility-associated-like protein
MQLQCSRDRYLSQAGFSMKIPAVIFLLLLFSLVTKAADLYWVGGSGQWSDINHWSLTSGNSGGHLSPSIPQSGDNVFFDANSGFTQNERTVSINQESQCNNLLVKSAVPPLFSGTILNLYGSADFQTGTVIDNTIYCKGTGFSTVNFNREVTGEAVIYFMGTGTYTLNGKLNSTGKIYFLKGILNFGSSNITTGFFDEGGCCGTVPISATPTRILDLGSSVITLTDRNSQSNTQSPSWAYSGSTLIAGTSQINLTKGADDGYGVFFYGKANHIYHDVTFSNTANPLDSSPYGWYQVSAHNVSFKKLTFASSGFITTSCAIDSLNLAASKTYYILGDHKIGTIQNPTSPCDKPWMLSSHANTEATISSDNSFHLQNVRISGVKITGKGSSTVTNGIDMGNNSGWSFITTKKNLYWIGGGGNWEDPIHWTTNEDGTPSGGCYPTRNDNVLFNHYSGIISTANPVVINSPEAECNSIFWNNVPGKPVFKTALSNAALSIYGSSTWQKEMRYLVVKTKYLGLATENTITSNGVNIEGDTYFLSSGKWTLVGAFTSRQNDIIFSSGSLNTNDQTLTVRNFASLDEISGVRTLSLGKSVVNLGGNWNYIGYGRATVYLNAEESQINVTGKDAYFYYESGLAYNNISFTNPDGTSRFSSTFGSTSIPARVNALSLSANMLLNVGGNPTPIITDSLEIATSKKYLIGTNMELQVGHLKTHGNSCSDMLEIRSYLTGISAKLKLLIPTTIANAKVTDINAIGARLTVDAGIDGGNNQNIVINPAKSRDFYWIGGSGNWSDPTHWNIRTESTSIISEGCLPSTIDNVFFDEKSGISYKVNIDIPANCNTMTWQEVTASFPVLKGLEANPLNINGSLILQVGMEFDVERTNFVGNTTGNTITTNDVVMRYTSQHAPDKGVFFNNIKGSWFLTDAFNVKNFGVINGTFNTNNNTVNADNFCSEYVPEMMNPTLLLGSSVVNISGYWDASYIKSLNSGASVINMTGLMPSSNSSGSGLNNNEFRSAPNLFYNDLNFTNSQLPAKITENDITTGTRFNSVTFAGESFINGSNQFNTLTLGVGKNSHLMAGSTQTVEMLNALSSCGNWDFDNNNAALQASIKSNSDINLSRVRLSGIQVIGEADYRATGLDLGNNAGWKFSIPTAQNLYWIGGNGIWSDPTHWTTNADGTPSGGCIPTRNDNVFFTNYSGNSPAIASDGTAEFHNMIWSNVSGTPSIGGTLNCYGSLTLQSSLSHVGGINFLSEEQSTITTNGAILTNNFDINFSGSGTYTLLDDLTTNSRINFTKGALNTNGKTLTALSFNGHETSLLKDESLSLTVASSKIFLSDADGWTYTGTHLNAENSQIFLIGSASYFKGKDGSLYHAISFDGNGTTNKLYGSITSDTLRFAAKNTAYQLQAGKAITARSQLQMSGNNCSIVHIGSTAPGASADLCVKDGNTTFNFLTIQDINASCLSLTILPQSTDGGNTTNVKFLPNQGSGIGILGDDITICAAQLPFVLDGSAMMPNDNTTIQWTNVETGEILGAGITQAINQSGSYQIKVIYGENCEVKDEIVVKVDPESSITNHIKIVQPTCSVATGSLTIIPQDNIIYSVDGGSYSELEYYELVTGKHSITAKNKADCVSDTTWITIDPQPILPSASINYGAGEFQAKGNINVTLSGQTGGTYSAIPLGLAFDATTGNIDLEKSRPDQFYTITYSFTNGSCNSTCTTTIRITPSKAAIAYPLLDYCAVGEVKIIQEGAKNGIYSANPAGLNIDEQTGKVNLHLSSRGQYVVTYTYKDGSETKQAVTGIKVNSLPVPTITSSSGTEIIKGQSSILTVSGGTSYAWIGPEIQNGQNTQSITISPKETATYTVIATNDEGCSSSLDFTITVKKDQPLIPNNVVTPNGDGKNDTWIIKNIEQYPNNTVRIFDRAGRLIYVKKGYSNEWDGTLNGKLLNEDAYIFVVHPGNGTGILRGTISVIRDQQ